MLLCLGDDAPIPKGGVKPTFTERPIIRQEGDGASAKVVFECKLVGEPMPEILWYHNETKIKEGKRHKIKVIKETTPLHDENREAAFYFVFLEIYGAKGPDAGIYKAVAKNASGEGHATINLTFEEGKTMKSIIQ